MTTEKAITMIDEYLLEPNNIDKAWVEVLGLCKQMLWEKEWGEKFVIVEHHDLLKEEIIKKLNGSCVYIIADESRIKNEAINEFQQTSKNRLMNLYEKYHAVANNPLKGMLQQVFSQERAAAIQECINVNDNLVSEMIGGD